MGLEDRRGLQPIELLRRRDVEPQDGRSGRALAWRDGDEEPLHLWYQDPGLRARRSTYARQLPVVICVVLLEHADVSLAAERIDTPVAGVPDDLVAALGCLEAG